MSAVNDVTYVSPDSVRRYRTRCKVRVDSHHAGSGQNAQPLWLYDDVIAVQTSKNLKSAGQASISLTASTNWLNFLFPGDYINVYFDLDDGEGWTRAFFGIIDRVEETYNVDQNGKPNTTYHVVCSDFQKAFDRTMIYFNPHLAGRTDLAASDFAAPNVGGLALASRGVQVGGAPSDIVQNVILITMGFGTQFVLPPTYRPGLKSRLRRRRAELVQGQLSETAREAIERAGGTYEDLKESVRADATRDLDLGLVRSTEDQIEALTEQYGISTDQIEAVENESELIDLLTDRRLRDILEPSETQRGQVAGNFSEGALTVLEGTVGDSSNYLLDIVDTFTFMERRAMDGYAAGRPVWQKQGTLISILRSLSHEAVNELFFDLRPLSLDENNELGDEPTQGSYARIPDDAQGNIPESEGGSYGITYIPAVIMREYPFSTIDGLDLRGIRLNLEASTDEAEIGVLFFGSIFSDRPNKPGRHIVTMPNINVYDRAVGGEPSTIDAVKHLDVAVVSEQEIMKSQLGRSDSEHFNLFEFYSDAILGSDQRFYMHDLLPIVTPIHISRYGLRVRSVTTRFARYTLATSILPSSSTAEQAEEAEETPEEDFTEVVPSGDIIPPVTNADGMNYNPNSTFATWGYRRKPDIDGGVWAMHQGIDIVPTQALIDSPAHPEVKAIADGEVVISAPEGVYGGYGNIVVIKHQFEGIDVPIYSVYAHLHERKVGWHLDHTEKEARRPVYCATGAPGVAATRQEPQKVTKGTVIGTAGNTGVKAAEGKGEFFRLHLHFEIDKVFPPKNSSETPRIPLAGNPTEPPVPAGYDRSLDPVQFYQDFHGIDLTAAINSAGEVLPEAEYADQVEGGDDQRGFPAEPEDENRPREDVLAENDEEPLPEDTAPPTVLGAVDSAITRAQIIRWALLQDHWYQHNLEYLSGRITMRLAPEIRVGYRLDLLERNMSFYVEGVNHTWQYPDKPQTTLMVTRGQPNNPYPLYVLPNVDEFDPPEDQRKTAKSRLATYFLTPDVLAVRKATVLRGSGVPPRELTNKVTGAANAGETGNAVDSTQQDEAGVDLTYDERVVPSGAREAANAIDSMRARELANSLEAETPESVRSEVASIFGLDPGSFATEE